MDEKIIEGLQNIMQLSTRQRAALDNAIDSLGTYHRSSYYRVVIDNPTARAYLRLHGWDWRSDTWMRHAILDVIHVLVDSKQPENQLFLMELLEYFGADRLLQAGTYSIHFQVCRAALIRYALDNGADVTKSEAWHLTRHRDAIRVLMPYAIRYLRQTGNPDARIFGGSPLLHHAACMQDVEAIKALLEMGANPWLETWGDSYENARSTLGHTLLRTANLHWQTIAAFGPAGIQFAIEHGMHERYPELRSACAA